MGMGTCDFYQVLFSTGKWMYLVHVDVISTASTTLIEALHTYKKLSRILQKKFDFKFHKMCKTSVDKSSKSNFVHCYWIAYIFCLCLYN